MKNIEYLIQKYPLIFKDYEGNPGRVNWYCPKGWIEMVDVACYQIQSHIDNMNLWAEKNPEKNQPVEQLTCLQIKEKFGGLRFYTGGGDGYCQGIISYIGDLSYSICESCGSNQDIGYTKGWISTVCIKCKDNYKNQWEPKKETEDKYDKLIK